MISTNKGRIELDGTLPELISDTDLVISTVVKNMIPIVGKIRAVDLMKDVVIASIIYGVEESEVE